MKPSLDGNIYAEASDELLVKLEKSGPIVRWSESMLYEIVYAGTTKARLKPIYELTPAMIDAAKAMDGIINEVLLPRGEDYCKCDRDVGYVCEVCVVGRVLYKFQNAFAGVIGESKGGDDDVS